MNGAKLSLLVGTLPCSAPGDNKEMLPGWAGAATTTIPASSTAARGSDHNSPSVLLTIATATLTTTGSPARYGLEHRDAWCRSETARLSRRTAPGIARRGSKMDTETPAKN